jgi:hypothetical protein
VRDKEIKEREKRERRERARERNCEIKIVIWRESYRLL